MAAIRSNSSNDNGATRPCTLSNQTNKITKSTNTSTSKHPPRSSHAVNVRAKPKPKRQPGRPFKMKSPASTSEAKPSPPTSTPAGPRIRRLSILETLPVEVIENIFLYSLNLNLPRASPVLAAALSSERIYRLLILLAFWEDSAFREGRPYRPASSAIKRILTPVDYDYIGPIDDDRRRELQDQIFSTKWCTMDRLLQQVPTLINLTIHRRWLDVPNITMEPVDRAALQKFMDREDDSVVTFKGRGPVMDLHRAYPRATHDNNPTESYTLRITPMTQVKLSSFSQFQPWHSAALSLLRFPDKLLRGRSTGFTAADVAFLEMLRMTSNNYTHPNRRGEGRSERSPALLLVNRSALHEGVSKAIETRNYDAMISLLKLDEYSYRDGDRRGQPYSIPAEHFIHVAKVWRKNPENPSENVAFFEALLRTNAESVPANSPLVMEWAIAHVLLAQKDPTHSNMTNALFARWLSNFMLKMSDGQNNNVWDPDDEEGDWDEPISLGPAFTNGMVSRMDVYGFFDEVLKPSGRPRFGNWMAESTFPLDGLWVKRAPAS